MTETTMPITVVRYRSAEELWPVAGPLLAAEPVRHTVPLSLLHRMLRGSGSGDRAEPVLLAVFELDRPIGVAVCTPPFPITVSAVPPAAADAVVEHLLATGVRPPGASGSRAEVAAFGRAWSERTGDRIDTHMEQLLYRLGELTPPAGVPGAATLAVDDTDTDLLIEWRRSFHTEADNWSPNVDFAAGTRASFAAGSGQVLWRVDGVPVALAVVGVPTGMDGHTMSRIGPVYTPPEHRGHGYGSAVTAAASRWALDRGAAHVALYTDLANPVSNAIYRRIGYRVVGEALTVGFAANPVP